ncbi:MAG: hypothetical protein N3A66_05950, partial [Planctomycetota bacterium]|nr:hypothetical protein [Planctomycetota bacterium]
MPDLFRSLAAAAQRLRAVLFFRALQQHLILALACLLVLALLDKGGILPLTAWSYSRRSGGGLIAIPLFYRQIILGLLALALLGAALRARLVAITPSQTALLLDKRLALAERLVSAVTAARDQPLAAALLADAERCCLAIRPAEVFRWSPGRGGYFLLGEIAGVGEGQRLARVAQHLDRVFR